MRLKHGVHLPVARYCCAEAIPSLLIISMILACRHAGAPLVFAQNLILFLNHTVCCAEAARPLLALARPSLFACIS